MNYEYTVINIFAPYLIGIIIIFIPSALRIYKYNKLMKKVSIYPEFDLGEIKFYEFAILNGRNLSTKGYSAIAVYYYLNKDKDSDEIERDIQKKYANKNFIKKLRAKDKYAKIDQLADKAFKKLEKIGYVLYNPNQIFVLAGIISLVLIQFIFTLLPIVNEFATSILGKSSIIDYENFFSGLILFLLICFPFYLFLTYENFEKVLPLRRKILGFKMFLNTTEYYTVIKDEVKFRKYMPYFIIFGIHKKYTNEMIDYALGLESKF